MTIARNENTRRILPGADPATPVYVLTGFLGSGKTTLLRHLVHRPDMADTAVIVNEFGEVGLDHLLVAKGEEDDIVLLESGCLCCTLNSSLAETLSDLFHRRARGEIPTFGRVVIETTGLADPAPILQTLMSDRFLASRYRLAAVLATLDALHFLDQAAKFEEAAKQTAMADRLILTKTDLVDGDRVARVRAGARALNRRADILETSADGLPPGVLLAPADLDGARAPVPDGHGHAHHAPGIATHFRPVPRPVTWVGYDAFVRAARDRLGEGLLRVKGLLRFADEAGPRVIQGVRHVFAPPEALDSASVKPLGLVFIVRDRSAEAIDALMAELTDTAGPTTAAS